MQGYDAQALHKNDVMEVFQIKYYHLHYALNTAHSSLNENILESEVPYGIIKSMTDKNLRGYRSISRPCFYQFVDLHL